jgi:hypothetical protein
MNVNPVALPEAKGVLLRVFPGSSGRARQMVAPIMRAPI